jgi:uncharacterized membrane protein YfcA
VDAATVALLCGVVFATSVLSAIVGLAGGMVLLSVMLLFLPPLEAIPLHGAIQLVANASRSWVQRRDARYDLLWRYALPLVPFGIVGLWVAREVPEAALSAAIGVFVLVATWAPKALGIGARAAPAEVGRRFLVLGAASGFLNVTIGATGPFVAPFFLGLGLSRQAVIGSQAATQALGHLVKIALYGTAGFSFTPHLALLGLGSACSVAGTWLGSLLLERVSERVFVVLYRGVLTAIALYLAFGALA